MCGIGIEKERKALHLSKDSVPKEKGLMSESKRVFMGLGNQVKDSCYEPFPASAPASLLRPWSRPPPAPEGPAAAWLRSSCLRSPPGEPGC